MTINSNDRPAGEDEQSRTAILKPYCSLGAGCLSSYLRKIGNDGSGWRYRFNIYRLAANSGRVSQLFRPADLIHFVKLVQVLASVIADDGCLSSVDRGVLRHLATELDVLLNGVAPANSHLPSSQAEETHSPSMTKDVSHGNRTDS